MAVHSVDKPRESTIADGDATLSNAKHLSMASHRTLRLSGDRVAVIADRSTGWCVVPNGAYAVLRSFFESEGWSAYQSKPPDAASRAIITQLWRAGLLLADGAPHPSRVPKRREYPDALLIKLTGGCNISCTYCYDYDRIRFRKRLDRDRTLSVVDELLDRNDSMSIAFHGGEPLLEFELLKEVVNHVNRRIRGTSQHVRFGVQTNGTLLTPEIIDFLKGERFSVGISLDGAVEEANSLRVVRRGNTPLQMVRALLISDPEFVRSSCGFLAVATKTSAPYLPNFALWLQGEGVTGLTVGFMDLTGRATDLHDFQLSPAQAVDLISTFVKMVQTKEIWSLALHSLITHMRNLFTYQSRDLCAKGPCGAASEFLVLDATGALRTCDCVYDPFFELAGPNEAIPNNRHVKRLALVSRYNGLRDNGAKCGTCPLFGLCGGTCVGKAIAASGNSSSINPVECAISTYLYPLLLEEISGESDSASLMRYYSRHNSSATHIIQTCLQ